MSIKSGCSRANCRPAVVHFVGIVLVCLAGLGGNAFAIDRSIVVKPQVTDELLANPGMGWETFNQSSKGNKNLPSWIPSTIYYARWSWRELEPQPGIINTGFLDQQLQEAHRAGQKLAFRVKAFSPNVGESYDPTWLKKAGGRELMVDHQDSGRVLPIPDFDDPATLQLHLDFIKQLGERYDGNPDLDHVDIGSLGWWGEWHVSHSKFGKMPKAENCQKVLDAYLSAFKKTPLLMLINGKEFTTYATSHGTGWRADSLGDLGAFSSAWNHMINGYPDWISQSKVQDVWKTAPVAFEPPGEISVYVEKKWPLRWIFNYGLALHGSYFNGTGGSVPNDKYFQEELTRFLRRLGYRLVLQELSYPEQVKRGGKFNISSKWKNVGSAPCYRPYRLAYRLTGANGYQKVIISPTTVNHWLPGSIELFTEDFFKEPADLPPGPVNEVTNSISLPSDIPTGDYFLSVAIVGVDIEEPVVKLGIAGRSPDGWYPLSSLKIVP